MILYLHGFRSSPASFKARLLADEMARRGLSADWRCPQLPASPTEAARLAMSLAREQLDELARRGRPSPRGLTVIGSSLGGYYATWLAEQLDCKAVLLNPAVHAPRDLATQVGHQSMYHSGAPFEFRASYVDELAALKVERPTHPERYFLIAATGDEVLDWREMRDWYAGCRQRIVEGSDHGLSDFAVWMPEVLGFALDAPSGTDRP
ncbi:YqiA/YcfP family alpha/beta fold hydrolase [Bordetella genomosp. 11]|uniref:Esterase n=1 Tax=Bordetella genomosp. 11 TaxID=1416808 RepID=A0A261UKU4_9BORD|nr:YqiA/YcfP family alpha/beta fold hydrolase [Bordetella genomosp. 11]OZI62508.1 esterase [Bordetella genomosp. 11]